MHANRWDETRDLLTKLLATSKQVLGPHHSITRDVEFALERVNIHSIFESNYISNLLWLFFFLVANVLTF